AKRLARLTSETGWLTLSGLFWLKDGKNTFGRASSNALRLDNNALAPKAGAVVRTGNTVRFVANPKAGVTHEGKPVTTIDLVPDTKDEPTVLDSGPVSFYLIERVGKY